MAEETGTHDQDGRSDQQDAPTGQGTDTGDATTIVAPPADDDTTPSAQAEELEQLQKLAEKAEIYKRQLHGWEQQSAKHKQENEPLKAQIAQLQQLIESRIPAATAHHPQEPYGTPAQATTANGPSVGLKEAIDKYLEGDESALMEWERSRATVQQPQPINIEEQVDKRLQTLMTTMQRQQLIGQRHAELSDTSHPLYRRVYETYDEAAAAPLYQALYPKDPQFEIVVPGPDGISSKTMDIRIVNDLALQYKLHSAAEQHKADQVGTAESAAGGKGRGGELRIKAWQLLTPGEKAEIQNLIVSRAIPADWPRDPKAIAKKVFEGLPKTQQEERILQFKRTARTGV